MVTRLVEWRWERLGSIIDRQIKSSLSPARYQHSVRVARVARSLARRFGESPARAWFTGLAHDIAREWSIEELQAWIQAHGKDLAPAYRDKEVLAHGYAGAWVLRSHFRVRSASVLRAIQHHTLGHEHLDTLGLILFAADYLEPGRKFTTPAFRRKALHLDLARMVLTCVAHNEARGKDTHPLTLALVDYLSKQVDGGIVPGRKD